MKIPEQAIISLARKDPLVFAYYVFRTEDEGLPLIPEQYQRDWQEFFTQNKRGIILSAPQIGKSVQITQIRLLWELCNNCDKRYAIISGSSKKAQKNLQIIKDIIQFNENFKKVYPNIKIDSSRSNTSTEFTIVRREGIKEPSLSCYGTSTTIQGFHFDGVIIDDPQDATNSSEQNSEKLFSWLGLGLIGRLAPDAFVYCIANSYSSKDFVHLLIQNTDWPTWTTPIILDEGLSTERSIWPSVWTMEKINERRREIGEKNFRIQYLNDTSVENNSMFEASWFEDSYINNFEKKYGDYIIGVDLASGLTEKHDLSSFSILFFERLTKKRTLIDTIAGRFTYDEKLEKIKNLRNIYPTARYYIEKNYNDAEIEIFKKAFPDLVFNRHSTTTATKLENVLERFHVELARKYWYIVKNSNNLAVVNDIKRYCSGDHMPDRVSSLLIGLQAIEKISDYQGPIQF